MKKRLFLLVALCASLVFADEQVSKKELFSRARDALKTALETGNKERAGQALGYLQKNVKDGAPLIRFEDIFFPEWLTLYADDFDAICDFIFSAFQSINSAKKET